MSKILELLKVAGKQGARFAGVTYTSKDGETSEFVLQLNGNYNNLIVKSREQLESDFPTVAAIVGNRTDAKGLKGLDTPETQAAGELLASFNKTLACIETGTENDDYTKTGLYESVFRGVKRHRLDDSLELSGTVISKRVLVKGPEKKPVKSSEKTLAKNRIKRTLPVGKFRTLCLEGENLTSLRFGQTEAIA